MHYCQSCAVATPTEPASSAAVCPRCGRSDAAPREPLLVVSGASGSGKSTIVAPLARELAGEAAVFDIDYLIDAFAIQAGAAPLDWRAIRAAWLSVAAGVAQSGMPTVLLGPLAPLHLEDLAQRRWVRSIQFFLLDCPDDVRRRRLEARPAWRQRDVEDQTRWGAWLRENIQDSVDTGVADVDQTVGSVAGWVRSTCWDRPSGDHSLGGVEYRWRGEITDPELVTLTESHGGRPEPGLWDRVRRHSLGWVTARLPSGPLVGFVNVAWDGGDHAFLLDPKVRADYQRRGVGRELVGLAAVQAKRAGCEWLEVDFDDETRLDHFYFGACGFHPTKAGLIHLTNFAE
jgi:ribosomal protein S18 acetylase RimI-like enzyme